MWTSNEMSGGFMVVVLGGFDLLGVLCLLGAGDCFVCFIVWVFFPLS